MKWINRCLVEIISSEESELYKAVPVKEPIFGVRNKCEELINKRKKRSQYVDNLNKRRKNWT